MTLLSEPVAPCRYMTANTSLSADGLAGKDVPAVKFVSLFIVNEVLAPIPPPNTYSAPSRTQNPP